MTLQPLVDRHAILAFEKQLHAFDVIGEASWWVDLDAGTIVFGGERELGAELLGTEAGGTWLWGWANPGDCPEPVIAAGRRLSALAELPERELRVSEDVSLDRIGLVASGVLVLDATYTGPLDEDARILLALRDASLALPAPEALRVVTVLATVLEAGFVRDWPTALAAYGAQRGLSVDSEGSAVVLDGRVEVEFDGLGRVAEIRSR